MTETVTTYDPATSKGREYRHTIPLSYRVQIACASCGFGGTVTMYPYRDHADTVDVSGACPDCDREHAVSLPRNDQH